MKIALSFLALLLSLTGAMAAEPIPSPKPIFFATGSTSGTVGGRVIRGERNLYSVKAAAGQTMTVTMTTPDDNAVFQIYQPGTTIGRDSDGLLEFHGTALHGAGDGEDATRWSGRLPAAGRYLLAARRTPRHAPHTT